MNTTTIVLLVLRAQRRPQEYPWKDGIYKSDILSEEKLSVATTQTTVGL